MGNFVDNFLASMLQEAENMSEDEYLSLHSRARALEDPADELSSSIKFPPCGHGRLCVPAKKVIATEPGDCHDIGDEIFIPIEEVDSTRPTPEMDQDCICSECKEVVSAFPDATGKWDCRACGHRHYPSLFDYGSIPTEEVE
jgi:hypothetical protein